MRARRPQGRHPRGSGGRSRSSTTPEALWRERSALRPGVSGRAASARCGAPARVSFPGAGPAPFLRSALRVSRHRAAPEVGCSPSPVLISHRCRWQMLRAGMRRGRPGTHEGADLARGLKQALTLQLARWWVSQRRRTSLSPCGPIGHLSSGFGVSPFFPSCASAQIVGSFPPLWGHILGGPVSRSRVGRCAPVSQTSGSGGARAPPAVVESLDLAVRMTLRRTVPRSLTHSADSESGDRWALVAAQVGGASC